MIVDNEPNIRTGLRYLINWEKYNFTIMSQAKNGKDALTKMEKEYPDLIITDIKMPGMDGLELIKYIREELHDHYMNFIILSGYDEFNYAKEAIKYNVRNYLLKPIDENELISTLELINRELTKESLYENFYEGNTKIFNERFENIKEISLLIEAIENNNNEEIKKYIETVFKYFRESNLHPRIIKIHIDNLIISLSNIISNMDGDIDNIVRNYCFFRTDLTDLNVTKLEHSLLDFSGECASYIFKLRQSCRIVNKIKHYVQENYSEDIKLKDIAKKYYINTAYLGQLFKKETGVNFSQYLNMVRIENAKKMLKRTDLHIYQIAEKVGYKNPDYFIIRFKESEKCTPYEYKNRP